jgi:hypothetical protein
VLLHPVEPVRELALARRPRGRESLVGDAAEEQRFGGRELVELEPVALGAALVDACVAAGDRLR